MNISTYIDRNMIFVKISYIGQYMTIIYRSIYDISILTDICLHIPYNLYVIIYNCNLKDEQVTPWNPIEEEEADPRNFKGVWKAWHWG